MPRTLKNAIEALRAPHTEVASVTVNAEPATLGRLVHESDIVEVHPWSVQKYLGPLCFVADAKGSHYQRMRAVLGTVLA